MNDQLIFVAQNIVRESGYNLHLIMREPPLGDDYSRAVTIYKEGCKLLRLLDEDNSESFIFSTWKGE